MAINGGAAVTDTRRVDMNLTFDDGAGSGPGRVRFKNDGGNWGWWNLYASTKTWYLPFGDGTKKVWVQFKDDAGNQSPEYSDTIVLDTTPPDTEKPIARMVTPFVSTRISKTTTIKVKWSATDASPSSAME